MGNRESRDPAAELRRRFSFTRSEAEIALLLAHGLSYGEIAERLGVSYHTVNTHIKAIHQKAGVSTTGRLLALLYHAREPSK
jgi:DNA-binding CsgD family transcriptional regulator